MKNMTISNVLETNFMPTVLPFQVMYGTRKKEKMLQQHLHGNCKSIFQYNKKVLFMAP